MVKGTSLALLITGLDAAGERLPALETLLARADRRDELHDADALLFRLFAVTSPSGHDLPVAPYRRLADGGTPDDGFWLCADPVHLTADQDQVYLAAAGPELSLSAEEAQRLAADFNGLYGAEGWEVQPLTAQHWYLHLPQVPHLATIPLHQVLGGAIGPHLPIGPEAMSWHRVLNEVQMLFHGSAVNAARRRDGRPVINSVWLWGGGVLSAPVPAAPWHRVWADAALARGLALHHGVPVHAVPEGAAPVLAHLAEKAPTLAMLDLAGRSSLAAEQLWFAPLREALRDGRLAHLTLYWVDAGLVLENDRATLRRWWRRRCPIRQGGAA